MRPLNMTGHPTGHRTRLHPLHPLRVVVSLACALTVGAAAPGHAQFRAVKAEVTAVVKADVTAVVPDGQDMRGGATIRVTARIKLPDNLHVQSNKPRDASLIPTILTIDPPAGVRVVKITYPAATELTQPGQRQPLAVFGHDFTITAHLAIAVDAVGERLVPARLRYQACDETMCYPPARVEARWMLRIN